MKKENVRLVVLIALLCLAIFALGLILKMEKRSADQMVMQYQLQAIRTSVNLFKAIEKRNPASFKELAAARFSFPGESEERHFLEGVQMDNNGEARDPFGNKYIYDPVSGWVRSNTAGYFNW